MGCRSAIGMTGSMALPEVHLSGEDANNIPKFTLPGTQIMFAGLTEVAGAPFAPYRGAGRRFCLIPTHRVNGFRQDRDDSALDRFDNGSSSPRRFGIRQSRPERRVSPSHCRLQGGVLALCRCAERKELMPSFDVISEVNQV